MQIVKPKIYGLLFTSLAMFAPGAHAVLVGDLGELQADETVPFTTDIAAGATGEFDWTFSIAEPVGGILGNINALPPSVTFDAIEILFADGSNAGDLATTPDLPYTPNLAESIVFQGAVDPGDYLLRFNVTNSADQEAAISGQITARMAQVPEPATLGLLGAGLVGLGVMRRRRRT